MAQDRHTGQDRMTRWSLRAELATWWQLKIYLRNAAGSFEIRHTDSFDLFQKLKKSRRLYFSYFACRFSFYIVKLDCRHIYNALYSNVWLKCNNLSHTFLSYEAHWLILNIAVADIIRLKSIFFPGTFMTLFQLVLYTDFSNVWLHSPK